MEHRLLNETEAAAMLGLKPATLRRWRWEGRGPRFRKIGGAVRYRPEDLTIFVDSARRSNTSETEAV